MPWIDLMVGGGYGLRVDEPSLSFTITSQKHDDG